MASDHPDQDPPEEPADAPQQGPVWVNRSGLPDRATPSAEAATTVLPRDETRTADGDALAGETTSTAERPATPDDKRKKKEKSKGPLAFLRELPILLLVAFLLALLIKTFLVQAFYIPSESMEPTLNVGDRVLVNKVVYHLHPPRHGDVIVFSDPNPGPEEHRTWWSAFWHWLTEGLGVSTNPEKDFIKRVIALPGDTIEIKNGQVFINGKKIDEPYLSPIKDRSDYPPKKIPDGFLFVMGDNRTNSRDSRSGLGLVPMDKVIGRAFVIIWPPSRVGLIHGH